YSRALNALEKVVDSTQAIKQIGKGMTFWVSGLYTQGQLASMFGNPAMNLKHYGIMAGTHYKDAATQQIFGVAVNVGFSNSISRGDRDLRTDNKAAQITLYYNKKFDASWKFSLHNTLMRSMDRHQRPFTDPATGNKQIAISNGVTYEFASMAEVSYKHEFSKDNYIKPFTSFNYTLNKEMAYQEKNVGRFNKAYANAGMEQIGLQFGIKSSFGHKISDTKTFVIMPKLSYTNFVKMGITSQKNTDISTGVESIGKSGTPGRHLISATLGAGVVDYEANTTTRFSYTGNVQKQKRSHEFLLDWGTKF
ncbi:MAG: autotransporter outer membrane beta-barrel domain-containing protein, partial [Alphaproteobacteria bacterium]